MVALPLLAILPSWLRPASTVVPQGGIIKSVSSLVNLAGVLFLGVGLYGKLAGKSTARQQVEKFHLLGSVSKVIGSYGRACSNWMSGGEFSLPVDPTANVSEDGLNFSSVKEACQEWLGGPFYEVNREVAKDPEWFDTRNKQYQDAIYDKFEDSLREGTTEGYKFIKQLRRANRAMTTYEFLKNDEVREACERQGVYYPNVGPIVVLEGPKDWQALRFASQLCQYEDSWTEILLEKKTGARKALITQLALRHLDLEQADDTCEALIWNAFLLTRLHDELVHKMLSAGGKDYIVKRHVMDRATGGKCKDHLALGEFVTVDGKEEYIVDDTLSVDMLFTKTASRRVKRGYLNDVTLLAQLTQVAEMRQNEDMIEIPNNTAGLGTPEERARAEIIENEVVGPKGNDIEKILEMLALCVEPASGEIFPLDHLVCINSSNWDECDEMPHIQPRKSEVDGISQEDATNPLISPRGLNTRGLKEPQNDWTAWYNGNKDWLKTGGMIVAGIGAVCGMFSLLSMALNAEPEEKHEREYKRPRKYVSEVSGTRNRNVRETRTIGGKKKTRFHNSGGGDEIIDVEQEMEDFEVDEEDYYLPKNLQRAHFGEGPSTNGKFNIKPAENSTYRVRFGTGGDTWGVRTRNGLLIAKHTFTSYGWNQTMPLTLTRRSDDTTQTVAGNAYELIDVTSNTNDTLCVLRLKSGWTHSGPTVKISPVEGKVPAIMITQDGTISPGVAGAGKFSGDTKAGDCGLGVWDTAGALIGIHYGSADNLVAVHFRLAPFATQIAGVAGQSN